LGATREREKKVIPSSSHREASSLFLPSREVRVITYQQPTNKIVIDSTSLVWWLATKKDLERQTERERE
jgi:hypothetical protein